MMRSHLPLIEQVKSARLRRDHFEFKPTWECMEEYYVALIQSFGPSSEHLPTLRRLVSGMNLPRVVELGTHHGNSAFALMMGKPDSMACVDIMPCKYIDDLLRLASLTEVKFEFHQKDSRDADAFMGPVDLLYVDSEHTYDLVKAELQVHKSKCRRYIVFHDTVTTPEIVPAIEEELTDFNLVEEYQNGHGLQVWERR